jgi:hypothetical protein
MVFRVKARSDRHYGERAARYVDDSLADYLLLVNADV